MFISIVIPIYNERDSLMELHRQILMAIQNSSIITDYEILFVDDGSTDKSVEVLADLHEQDSKVHMIRFRKNFGKSIALDAGFHHVHGEIVFTMDGDLQDDPVEFDRFIEKINEGYDLVVGWKKVRLDPAEKRWPSKIYNVVTSYLSGVKLHDHDCGFKAFRHEVIQCLDLYGELHRYIPVLAYRYGFRIAEIVVTHHKREFGHSKYGVERYLRGFFDSLTTTFLLRYGDRPMYFFGKLGLILCLFGGVICSYLSVRWFLGASIGGRPLLVLGVLCLVLGVQSISTGFLGNLLLDLTHSDHYQENHIEQML